MTEFIIQLGLLVVVASLLGIIGKFLRQPPLIAYIFSGLLLGYFGLNIAENKETLDIISEIGIILLLYIAGLEIKFKQFLKTGKTAFIIGEGHDIIMMSIGMGIGYFLLGFNFLQSFYLGLALTLSSTIVVVKALEQRKEIEAPHGRVLMGTMLLQDLVAMGSLAVFIAISKGGSPGVEIALTLLKGAIVFVVLYLFGKYIMGKLFERIAGHIELVFLAGLMWAFVGVLFAHYIGFSKEIGAFIAGMSIAHLPFAFEIKDKTRSIQDFGLLLFFFTIGATVSISKDIIFSWTFALLVLFVLLATPIISGAIASFLALEKKRNFLIGVMPIQVSEFSLIVVAIGLKLGQINEYIFSLVTAITVATIILSSGILANLNPLYRKIEDYLEFLEWKVVKKEDVEEDIKGHAILLGMGNLGEHIAAYLKKKKMKVVVVDWLPDRIEKAEKLGCEIFYGDAGDPDVWEEIKADKAKIIISTIGNNQDDDVNIYNWIKKKNKNVYLISETNIPEDAKELNKLGYDHVLVQDEAEWALLKKFLNKLRLKK